VKPVVPDQLLKLLGRPKRRSHTMDGAPPAQILTSENEE